MLFVNITNKKEEAAINYNFDTKLYSNIINETFAIIFYERIILKYTIGSII